MFKTDEIMLFLNGVVGSVSFSDKAFEEGHPPHKTVSIYATDVPAAVAGLAATIYHDVLNECAALGISPKQLNFCWRLQPYIMENDNIDFPTARLKARARYSMWKIQ
jgi:hypothetical protein